MIEGHQFLLFDVCSYPLYPCPTVRSCQSVEYALKNAHNDGHAYESRERRSRAAGSVECPIHRRGDFRSLPRYGVLYQEREGAVLGCERELVHRCGLKRKSQLLGRTPEEVLIAPLGSSFAQQDRQLLDSGNPLTGQLELHIYASADVGWCITNKHPLTDKGGRIVGLVGVSRDLGSPRQECSDYESMFKS